MAIGLNPIGEEKVQDLVDPEDVVGGHVPTYRFRVGSTRMASSTLQLWITSPRTLSVSVPVMNRTSTRPGTGTLCSDQARDHRTVYVAYSLVLKSRWW